MISQRYANKLFLSCFEKVGAIAKLPNMNRKGSQNL